MASNSKKSSKKKKAAKQDDLWEIQIVSSKRSIPTKAEMKKAKIFRFRA